MRITCKKKHASFGAPLLAIETPPQGSCNRLIEKHAI